MAISAAPGASATATLRCARYIGGDRKANADTSARRRENRGIDADHLALGIERGTARIAPVDRRIDLQEVIVMIATASIGGLASFKIATSR
jgi:hypothetical protein